MTKGVSFQTASSKLIARQNAAAMRGEIFQQPKFANRGENVAPADLHGHGVDIDLKICRLGSNRPRWESCPKPRSTCGCGRPAPGG